MRSFAGESQARDFWGGLLLGRACVPVAELFGGCGHNISIDGKDITRFYSR